VKTWKRICIQDYELSDKAGQRLVLTRGSEYLTSLEAEGLVMVFTDYWATVPVSIFAGEQRFT
jgi:hypothetical protein